MAKFKLALGVVFCLWAELYAEGPGKGSLTGVVVDSTDNKTPIEGVSIRPYWRADASQAKGRPHRPWPKTTDQFGKFTIASVDAPGLMELEANKSDPRGGSWIGRWDLNGDRFIPTSRRDVELPQPIKAQYTPPGSLVTTNEGTGPPGIRVRLVYVSLSQMRRISNTQSGPHGATGPRQLFMCYRGTPDGGTPQLSLENLSNGEESDVTKWFSPRTPPPGVVGPCGSVDLRNLREGDYRLVWTFPRTEPETWVVMIRDKRTTVALRTDGRPVDLMKVEFKAAKAEPMAMMPVLERGLDSDTSRRNEWTPDVINYLPLPGLRSPDILALLAPGILLPPATDGMAGPGLLPGLGTAGQFTMNGLRSREVNFTLDGSDNNDEETGVRRQGFVAPFPQSVESLADFHVISASADVRYGRSLSGQINAVTRRGFDGWHGQAFGFLTSSVWNARDYFDTRNASPLTQITVDGTPQGRPVRFDLPDGYPSWYVVRDGLGYAPNPGDKKDSITRRQVGFTGGGTFKRTGVSLFGSFERKKINASREQHFVVPSMRERGVFNTGGTGLVNASNNSPLVPAAIRGDAIFSLIPLPNNPVGPFGGNTYSTSLPSDGNAYLYSGRVAKSGKILGSNDSLSLRYARTTEESVIPSVSDAIFSSVAPRIKTENLAGYWSTSWSARVSHEFWASIGRSRLDFQSRQDPRLFPSRQFPNVPYLLNAPLLINQTNLPGTNGEPIYGTLANAPPTSADSMFGNLFLPSRQQQFQTEWSTFPVGQIKIAGYNPVGLDVFRFPQDRSYRTWQLGDSLSIVRGGSIWTAGFEVRRFNLRNLTPRNERALVEFGGVRNSPFSLAQFRTRDGRLIDSSWLSAATLAAMGAPTGYFQTYSTEPESHLRLRRTSFDLYLNHSREISKNLRGTIGARFLFQRLPQEVDQRFQRSFDTEALRALAEEAARAAREASQGLLPFSDFAAGVASIFPDDFGKTFGADSADVDIRGGIAWQPASLSRSVVRLGFGVYSGVFPVFLINESRSAFPDYLPLNLAHVEFGPTSPAGFETLSAPSLSRSRIGLQSGSLNVLNPGNPLTRLVLLRASLGAAIGILGGIFSPIIPEIQLVQPASWLKNSYSYQGNLGYEFRLTDSSSVSLFYVMTIGKKLLRAATPAGGALHSSVSLARSQVYDPYPNPPLIVSSPNKAQLSNSLYVSRTVYEATAQSNYHSLQAEWKRRFAGGFLIGTSLTVSRAIDDASDFYPLAGSFNLPQNSKRRDERGLAAFDSLVRSTAHFVADVGTAFHLPRLEGLVLSGIFTQQSGQPFTVNSIYDVNADGNLTDRPNSDREFLRETGDRSVALKLREGVDPLSLLAAPGQDGIVGRNVFRADGMINLDLALQYPVLRRERVSAHVRTEIFNVTNRSNFGMPNRILESPGFGRSYYTTTGPRTLQFALRVTF